LVSFHLPLALHVAVEDEGLARFLGDEEGVPCSHWILNLHSRLFREAPVAHVKLLAEGGAKWNLGAIEQKVEDWDHSQDGCKS